MRIKSIHVPHLKNAAKIASTEFLSTSRVILPVSQHIGAPCTIKEIMTSNGRMTSAICIESDGKYEMCDLVAPEITDKKSLIDAVRKSGAVGLGGAAFPTSVKLAYDKDKTPVELYVKDIVKI